MILVGNSPQSKVVHSCFFCTILTFYDCFICFISINLSTDGKKPDNPEKDVYLEASLEDKIKGTSIKFIKSDKIEADY